MSHDPTDPTPRPPHANGHAPKPVPPPADDEYMDLAADADDDLASASASAIGIPVADPDSDGAVGFDLADVPDAEAADDRTLGVSLADFPELAHLVPPVEPAAAALPAPEVEPLLAVEQIGPVDDTPVGEIVPAADPFEYEDADAAALGEYVPDAETASASGTSFPAAEAISLGEYDFPVGEALSGTRLSATDLAAIGDDVPEAEAASGGLSAESIPLAEADAIPTAEAASSSGLFDSAPGFGRSPAFEEMPAGASASSLFGGDVPAAEAASSSALFGTGEAEAIRPVAPGSSWAIPPTAEAEGAEPLAPVVAATGWFDSHPGDEPPPPARAEAAGLSGFDAIDAEMARPGPAQGYGESSDIFAAAPAPPARGAEQSDVIVATAFGRADPLTPMEPPQPLPATGGRASDVALTFDQPPGGSTVNDPDAADDLPIAEELPGDEADGPLDSARLADAPNLPGDSATLFAEAADYGAAPRPTVDASSILADHLDTGDDAAASRHASPDFGAAPPRTVDASSILADILRADEPADADDSAVSLVDPGTEATLSAEPVPPGLFDGPDAFGDPAPSGFAQLWADPLGSGSGDPDDWKQQSGSDLFADARDAGRGGFDLIPDAEMVDPFADIGPAEQPSLSSAPSSIFTGGKLPGASGGSSRVPLAAAPDPKDDDSAVDFSDHPDPTAADSGSLHMAAPAGWIDFDPPPAAPSAEATAYSPIPDAAEPPAASHKLSSQRAAEEDLDFIYPTLNLIDGNSYIPAMPEDEPASGVSRSEGFVPPTPVLPVAAKSGKLSSERPKQTLADLVYPTVDLTDGGAADAPTASFAAPAAGPPAAVPADPAAGPSGKLSSGRGKPADLDLIYPTVNLLDGGEQYYPTMEGGADPVAAADPSEEMDLGVPPSVTPVIGPSSGKLMKKPQPSDFDLTTPSVNLLDGNSYMPEAEPASGVSRSEAFGPAELPAVPVAAKSGKLSSERPPPAFDDLVNPTVNLLDGGEQYYPTMGDDASPAAAAADPSEEMDLGVPSSVTPVIGPSSGKLVKKPKPSEFDLTTPSVNLLDGNSYLPAMPGTAVPSSELSLLTEAFNLTGNEPPLPAAPVPAALADDDDGAVDFSASNDYEATMGGAALVDLGPASGLLSPDKLPHDSDVNLDEATVNMLFEESGFGPGPAFPSSGRLMKKPKPGTPPAADASDPSVVVNWASESAEAAPLAAEPADADASFAAGMYAPPEPAARQERKAKPRPPRAPAAPPRDFADSTDPTRVKPSLPAGGRTRGRALGGLALGLLLGTGAMAGVYYSGLVPNGDGAKVAGPNVAPPTPPDATPVAPVVPTAPATVADARAAIDAGDPARAVRLIEAAGAGADTAEAKAALGQARFFARLRALGQATAAADDAALAQARTDLEAAASDPAAGKTPAGEQAAIRATLHLGLAHELAGDRAKATAVYTDGVKKFPKAATLFEAALDRLAATDPDAGKTSLRFAPADGFEETVPILFVTADPPADEPAEAGAAFWKAVKAARENKYDEAIALIAEAKAAHVARARALAGRGLNPLTDPLEQVFPRCCDDLKAYWELRRVLYADPAAAAIARKDGVAKALAHLAAAEARAVELAKTTDALKTENGTLAADLKKAKEAVAVVEKDLKAEKDALAKLEKDYKAAVDTAADLEGKVKKADDAAAAALAGRKDADAAVAAIAAELQAGKLLPEKFDAAAVVAASKSAVSRATGPDLTKLVPPELSAVAGTGLSTGHLLDLAARVSKSEARATAAAAEGAKLKADHAAAVKKLEADAAAAAAKLTDAYAADAKALAAAHAAEVKKLTAANATISDTLKAAFAADAKKLADKYLADAKSLAAENATGVKKLEEANAAKVKELEASLAAERLAVATAVARFKANLANAVSPAQTLDLWAALLLELRRPADADPALDAAMKTLKASAAGTEDEAKALTVGGLALLLKGDAAGARKFLTAARASAAYPGAKDRAWAKAADAGFASVVDPAAGGRLPVAAGPRSDPAAAARALDAGIAAYKAGRFAAAEKALADAAFHAPADPVAWYFLGATRWAAGDPDKARDDFRQGAEREQARTVPARAISAALGPIQGPARDALTAARP